MLSSTTGAKTCKQHNVRYFPSDYRKLLKMAEWIEKNIGPYNYAKSKKPICDREGTQVTQAEFREKFGKEKAYVNSLSLNPYGAIYAACLCHHFDHYTLGDFVAHFGGMVLTSSKVSQLGEEVKNNKVKAWNYILTQFSLLEYREFMQINVNFIQLLKGELK